MSIETQNTMKCEDVAIPAALVSALDENLKKDGTENVDGLEKFISTPSQASIAETPQVPLKPIEAIVAFIDVLGTTDLMKKMSQDNVLEITTKIIGIKDLFVKHFGTLKRDLPTSKLMVISDSFVISIPKEEDAFSSLISMLAKCQYSCLTNHTEILRGAISTGAIIGGVADSNVIIGPAFIKAHNLENKNAIFPRIVIDKDIIDDRNICPVTTKLPLAQDKDGLRYIDFTEIPGVDLNDVNARIKTGSSLVGNDTGKLQKWHWLRTFLEQKTNACIDCCKPRSVIPVIP